MLLRFVPAEGLSHSVFGAGAGESQSSAGDQKQTTSQAGEKAPGRRQTGENWAAWKKVAQQ